VKNLFTVKSSDCSILLSRLQTSKAYSRIGRHSCPFPLSLPIPFAPGDLFAFLCMLSLETNQANVVLFLLKKSTRHFLTFYFGVFNTQHARAKAAEGRWLRLHRLSHSVSPPNCHAVSRICRLTRRPRLVGRFTQIISAVEHRPSTSRPPSSSSDHHRNIGRTASQNSSYMRHAHEISRLYGVHGTAA